ncbi:MAG: gluconate 2-dehydrogenase subunit 3 family protein [Gemmatimonadota bacterium]|nr:gluconate 2-dehydrogenase subunit 3 family protein [Gemmatimonadota bacterium]MDE3006257.1 gluconate 2-dehydrogenase subunit 3 family protein [Gemmatimonadota bacterium]MDE3014037.1 gluconate 2-dehydrogenase subunit 3 family protein [Gemmatimonadota bacterium]
MSGKKLPILRQEDVDGFLPMDRRQALKVMAIAAAAPTVASCTPEAGSDLAELPAPASNPKAAGTAWDPDLVSPTVPWERSLTADELESLAALCDVIIPADDRSSSASQVGAHDFIDEWVSAPYDGNANDQVLVRGGLVWLDREAAQRFGDGVRFRGLSPEQQHAICDDICYAPNAPDGYEAAARFFDRVRDLTSTAFWTTQVGMDDLEYVGNVPLAQWDPPPPEVLRHLGLA